MKGDFTRLTFDKKKHYRGVLMQQGRVQLDSDWNEQVQIAEHRYSTFFGDFVGQSGAPAGNSMTLSQKYSDALDLGAQTFITVAQLSSSLTGKAGATVQLWFRAGSTLSMDLKKDNLRTATGCILSLDEIAGFGVMSDGSPAIRFLSDIWQKIEIGKNLNKIDDDNWHYLAMAVRKNFIAKTCEIVIYLDGKQVAERSGSLISNERAQDLLNTLVLGAWSDNKTYYFGGDVADLRIWNSAIENAGTPPTAALTGKEQGLIRYYPLNEQDKATSAKDLSSNKKNAKITGTVSRCAGPYQAGKISLGKGRYYVDGLLVENENEADVEEPAKNGLYLAYLDVWGRHISAAEDETLLEPALGGPDTTTRIKTEWQLRYQYLGAKSAFTLDEIRKRYCGVWPQLSAPDVTDYWQLPLSTGRMKIDATQFNLTENQLYRVEVHTGNFDQDGKATTLQFKWSRNNGSIVATVKAIDAATKTIELADADLNIQNAFSDAGLIEICDEVCNRTGSPGYLIDADMSLIRDGKIKLKENWGYDRQPAELATPILIRRWDGVHNTKKFKLEEGLTVTFDGGDIYYRSGDYWLIPTRADGVMGWDDNISQPAHGVEHHFAALALITKETQECTFENLGIIFQPLTTGNLSKGGDTIDGDLCVMGRVSIGSSIFNAPLSINADAGGKLMSLKTSDETWRVHRGSEDTPSLSITDSDGNGLTIKKEGNVGIGTVDPQFKLDVKADKRIKLGLEGMGGGQLQIACNRDDNKIFLEAFNSTGDGHAAELLLTGMNSQNVPKLSLHADKTYINGKVGIGTDNPATKLDIAGGSLRVSYDNDNIEIDPWVGSNGAAISFTENGKQKSNLYWHKISQTFLVNSAGGSNTCLNLNGGNVGIGIMPQYKLDVNGSLNVAQDIKCERWKVTRVLRQAAGPLTGNGLLGNFTSSGGMLLVYAFGSGFSRTAGRMIGMQINVDNMMMGAATIFTNEAASHKSFVGTSIVITSVGAGNHTLKLYNLNLDTQTDANDIFDVTVMELPFR